MLFTLYMKRSPVCTRRNKDNQENFTKWKQGLNPAADDIGEETKEDPKYREGDVQRFPNVKETGE